MGSGQLLQLGTLELLVTFHRRQQSQASAESVLPTLASRHPPVDDEVPVQILEAPEHLQHDALDLCRGSEVPVRLSLQGSPARPHPQWPAGLAVTTAQETSALARLSAPGPHAPTRCPHHRNSTSLKLTDTLGGGGRGSSSSANPQVALFCYKCAPQGPMKPIPPPQALCHALGPPRRVLAYSPGGWPGPAHSNPSPGRC